MAGSESRIIVGRGPNGEPIAVSVDATGAINTAAVAAIGAVTIADGADVAQGALTDAEAAILAAGYSPLFVRPQSIRAYWPLIRGSADRVGGFALTEHNAPTVEDQSPVIYPYGYVTSGRVGAALATLRTLATLGAGR